MNALSGQFKDQLERRLELAVQRHQRPIAAFDADGTLWNTDLGEALFDFQIKNKLIRDLPADPWQHYYGLKVTHSPEVAYVWLAQICKGHSLSEVRSWAKASLDAMKPVPLFEEILEVMSWLHRWQVETYIVTASIKWAVEPGAHLFGLPESHVIGIETAVIDGLVTDQPFGPITYKRGKVDGLLARTQGVAPIFCAGNTEGDLPLLESSIGERLVIAAAKPGERNYDTERHMLEIAKQRGWLSHDYLKS